MATSTTIAVGICAILTSFALFAALGHLVSSRSSLLAFDARAVVARGAFVELAIVFTWLGYWHALTALSVLILSAAAFFHLGFERALLLVAVQGASQLTLNFWKTVYRRARPDAWLFRYETTFSYPSGHSATALTFYLALLLSVAHLPIGSGPRTVCELLLGCAVVGLPWSRIALGAHYPSDVLGGLLYGGAWLSLFLTVSALLA
ncbi:MAG TPA: phosphatase PAP2 family protein [Candidatus Acidoferrales bacterium]|nr:phosphatase PAP2 family protein [Candidatus Acidoferrales bacterium]